MIALPQVKFLINGFKTPFRVDRNGHGSGIILHIREDTPYKLSCKGNDNQIEGFFVDKNLKNKKKWLTNCSFDPYAGNIANHVSPIFKSTDIYTSKHGNLLFLGIS